MREEGYKRLEIYKKAHPLGVEIHKMSLTLPRFEMFEEGSQIRRSSKSISANIVEGYALRNYKNEFIRYLYRAYASCLETKEHLEYLYETKSLKDEKLFNYLLQECEDLGKMIYVFVSSVEKEHQSRR